MNSKIPYEQALDVAEKAARLAGHYILEQSEKMFRKEIPVETKPKAGFVTHVDRTAEAIIIQELKKHFPDYGIYGEEGGFVEKNSSSDESAESPFLWVIDPLDGTTNFIRGFPHYCVSIGLAEWTQDSKQEPKKCQPRAGVVYAPYLEDLYRGAIGLGAYKNGVRLQVSQVSLLKDALVSTGFSFEKDDARFGEREIFLRVSPEIMGVRRTGSAALDLCTVASGTFDIFYEQGLAPWDTAAGAALILEAGGRICQYDAQAFDIMTSPSIVATNQNLDRQILPLLS